MKIQHVLLLASIVGGYSCQPAHDKSKEQQQLPVEGMPDTTRTTSLEAGKYTYTEADFGEVIALQGTSHPVKPVIRVKECQMLAQDSLLLVCNYNRSNQFMAFSLPEFTFLKSFGPRGRGPGEFQFPLLVQDESSESWAFIYERSNNQLYGLDRNFTIHPLPIRLPRGKVFNDKQLHGISAQHFVYAESVPGGKALFQAQVVNHSLHTIRWADLAFTDQHSNWAAFTGYFGANTSKNRAVFAYKYFKRVVFFDLASQSARTLVFDVPENTPGGPAASMMNPSQVTHYWGISAQQNYVWLLYSGRSPLEVTKELEQSHGTIYVEQFTWNGQPVRKFQLDHWGYFCVNAQETTIYLASTTEVQPFFSYTLPAGHAYTQ